MIDLYCERIAPGLAGEPLNALSNLAFFFAAWRARRHGAHTGVLCPLLLAIGAGSSAFHLLASPTAELADVAPIALFQLVWLGQFLRGVSGWGRAAVAAALVAFAGLLAAASALPPWWNGSLGYSPAWLVLVVLAATGPPRTAATLRAASAWFTLSIALRSVDLAVCTWLPIGTHFLWHLLNARMLYLVIIAVADGMSTAAPVSVRARTGAGHA